MELLLHWCRDAASKNALRKLRHWGQLTPKALFWRVSERFGAKSGAPQKRRSNDDRSNAPFSALWTRVMPKGPRRTKNSTRSKFTTRTVFSTAWCFTIAARLVRTPFSWELQTFFLSKKGPWRTKFGGRTKKFYAVVIHYICYRRSIFSTEGSFGWVTVCQDDLNHAPWRDRATEKHPNIHSAISN